MIVFLTTFKVFTHTFFNNPSLLKIPLSLQEKKCRRISKGVDVKADCFTVVKRLAEHYPDVTLPNGGFNAGAPNHDHNGKIPNGWKNLNEKRVDTLSADITLQGASILKPSKNGGTFVRLNSNNIIIKKLGTKVQHLQTGHLYRVLFEQALLYKWGHCEGHFRVQLGNQVQFSPIMGLPTTYPSMSPWHTVSLGYYVATGPEMQLVISAVRGHYCNNPKGQTRTFTDLVIDNVYLKDMGPMSPEGAPTLQNPAVSHQGGYTGYTSTTQQKDYSSGRQE